MPLKAKQSNPRRSIVAFPTESFYALGVKANDAKAIAELFRLKHRQPGKPVALIAGSLAQVKKFFFLSPAELKLARKYWPGPLTIVLKPKKAIADKALGAQRIGVRVPRHAGARALALSAGAPLTATSANISGQPPTKSAAQVKKDFPGILVIPGRCGRARQPSTVIRLDHGVISILRPGAVRL